MDGTGSAHGKENHKILIGKPKWKRLLQRHRHRWEDNIKMELNLYHIGIGNLKYTMGLPAILLQGSTVFSYTALLDCAYSVMHGR
jgi:hypothetical protein